MTTNRKGRVGWHQATPGILKTIWKFTGLASFVKSAVITLALWGLLPVKMAEWIIRQGGLRDE